MKPGLDDKVLTAWNGLMLTAFAEAGRALRRPDYTVAAVENATFLHRHMWKENRLLRTWRQGAGARLSAYLEDYACLADGLIALYQSTFDERWFVWARELAEVMLARFPDKAGGGFFDTSDDHEPLIARPRDLQDNATPSGNAMAAMVLLKLGLLTNESRYWDIAESSITAQGPMMRQHPTGFGCWLAGAQFAMSEPRSVAIAGKPGQPDTDRLLEVVFARYRPNLVVAAGPDNGTVPLLAGRTPMKGKATAFVCQRFSCREPVTSPDALETALACRR